MTRPPRSRFETIIQGFLDNMQRGNENLQRRFEAQDQRDFAREQYQTQRDDYLADRLQDREWKLTDEARTLRLSQRDLLLENLWALERDDPDYDNVLALIAELGTPSQLTGEAAMREATNGMFPSADGGSIPIDMLIGRLKRKADNTQRGDDWAAQHVAEVSKYVRDFSRDPAARAAAINGVMALRNRGVTDDMLDALLATAGVTDPQDRQTIINAGVIDEQTIRLNEANIRRAEAGAAREEYEFQELKDTRAYRDEANQLQLRGLKQQLGLGDLDAFMRIGALPTDEEARRQLARMLGVDEEALAERGQSIYNQWARSQRVAVQLSESQLALNNVAIHGGKLQNAINQHAFNRAKAMENLNDRQAMAQSLAEAVALGQVEFVREMQALQDVYPDVLGGMDFDSLIEQAEFVRGDENDIRSSAAAQRKYAVTTAALAAARDLDDYIDRHASAFLPLALPSEYDPVSGSYPQLERAIDELVRNMPSAYLEEFGGEQLVRDRLRASVERQAVVKRYNDDAASLDALIANPPSPENPAARAAWQNQVSILVDRLGLDAQVWDALATNIMDSHELDYYTQVAKARLDSQQADHWYQSTVGQYIDNLTGWWDYEALRAGGGGGFDLGTMKELAAFLKTVIDGEAVITESPACVLAGTEEARMGGLGGHGFNPDGLGGECGAAMERQVAAGKALSALRAGFGYDSEGNEVFDPLATQGANPYAESGGAIPPPSAERVSERLAEQGRDASTFDGAVYESLSPSERTVVAQYIDRGMEPGEALDTMLGVIAASNELIRPPDGLPTLAEAGVNPRASEWLELPMAERVERLRGTREWQADAARFAEVGELAGLSVAEILDPRTDAAADALEAVFGRAITPDAAYRELGRRYGLLIPAGVSEPGAGEGLPPSAPAAARSGGLRGAFESVGGALGTAGRAIGNAAGNVADLARSVWDPELPPRYAELDGEFDVASFAAAMQEDADFALQRARDDARTQLRELRTEELRAREYAAWANPPVVEAQAGARPADPRMGVPGAADHRGSGGTGDYSGLRPFATGSTQGATAARGAAATPREVIEATPPVRWETPAREAPDAPFAGYYDLAEALLPSLVQQESGSRHQLADGSLITSSSGALGITQVMPGTGKSPGFGVTPLRSDDVNEYLRFGRDYLAALLHRYQGNIPAALAAYNAGAGNVDKALAAAGPRGNFLDHLPTSAENQAQTRNYVANITAMYGSAGAR